MKGVLTSETVLTAVDKNNDVYIFTVASEEGFGYVTMQKDDCGLLHPIAYGGQALTKAQKSYLPDYQ